MKTYIAFAHRAGTTHRVSPEFADWDLATDFLEYVKMEWPQAYLQEFECDERMRPATVAEQIKHGVPH